MIPFSLSLLPFYLFWAYVFGVPAVILLCIWGLRLMFMQQARQNLKQKPKSRIAYFLLLLLPSLTFAGAVNLQADLSELQKQVALEIEQEEKQRRPILQQDTDIAGMRMPVGTKLILLSKNAVGEAAVKADYFESANFPKPVQWKGFEITGMGRTLHTSHCFERHNWDFEKCETLPKEEQSTRVTWGWYLHTEMAKATKVDGFSCKSVNWIMPVVRQIENRHTPEVDAGQPAPDYILDSCQTAKGNRFQSANNAINFELAEDSTISTTRFIRPELPNGILDVWTGRDKTEILHTNLFSLQKANWYLDLAQHQLYEISGYIQQSRAACALPVNSYVQWHSQQPNILKVYAETTLEKCGELTIERLATAPEEIEWMELEPASENDVLP